MKRWTIVPYCLVVVAFLSTATPADAACGGNGELLCLQWSSCAIRVFGLCVPGFVPKPPYNGCNNDRLNNYFGICGTCGRSWAPFCLYGQACDPRHNLVLGLCVPCGRDLKPVCWSGGLCDEGFRNVYGFCASSGFSEEPECNCDVETAPPLPDDQPVRGIADIHVHQFINEGVGGAMFWGSPFHPDGINKALAWCDYTWDFRASRTTLELPDPTLGYVIHGPCDPNFPVTCPLQAIANPIGVIGTPEGLHWPMGTGSFSGWPKWSTTTHQQMYYRWVERAYKGGVRLMVQLAVSNEVGCLISKKRRYPDGYHCDDMFFVDRQIKAAYALQDFIDGEYAREGKGKGWYRIVRSPEEARQVIRDGKMAVVLGIEVDSLFGCKPGATHCSDAYIEGRLQHYYDWGVRHVFPVHSFDNYFAGAALYNPFWSLTNIIATGGRMEPDSEGCPDVEGDVEYDYKVSYDDMPFLSIFNDLLKDIVLPALPEVNAHCNKRGLTPAGEVLVDGLMERGMIIDVDHLSLKALNRVLEKAEAWPGKYPLVSSHSFLFDFPEMEKGNEDRSELHKTKEQILAIRDLGGIVAPLNPRYKCSSTRDYLEKYDYVVGLMRTSPDDEYPGIAFSTDFGGLFQQTAPRFGNDAKGCEWYDENAPRFTYPFTLEYPFMDDDGDGKVEFDAQVTGQRTFDFNEQGLAHYGLLPDFFRDLQEVAKLEEFQDLAIIEEGHIDLDPLFNSAEVYVRMWEKIYHSNEIPPPTVTARVEGTQGAGGWYTSDVEVSWEITADDPIISKTGCEPSTIAADTEGVELTCRAATQGGASEGSVTIKRDTVPPVVTSAQLITPEPASGWFNGEVRVAFEATDATSGLVGESPVEVTVYQEGVDVVATHTFTDAAGLTTTAELRGIRIDLTPPIVGFRFAHLPDDATPEQFEAELERWHNQVVILNVLAEDSLSGVDSISPEQLILAMEGAAVQGNVTATDLAGNSATLSSPPVKIDMTPPTIEMANRMPPPNAYGWNNGDITVTWNCQDALSGVVEPSVTETLMMEGADLSLTGLCEDQASNTAAHTVGGLNLDKTPPTIGLVSRLPAPNAFGWNNSDITVTWSCADSLADVLSPVVAETLTLEGVGLSLTGLCVDRADNTAQNTVGGLNLDKTPPTIQFVSRLPEPNAHGWNNTDITVTWNCQDGLSGAVADTVTETLATEGEGLSLTGECMDRADNTADHSVGDLNLDKTPPVLECAAEPSVLWPPNHKMVPATVHMDFVDALSGPDRFSLQTAESSEPDTGLPGGDPPDDIQGFELSTNATEGFLRAERAGNGPGRVYTLGYGGLDKAGNGATCRTTVSVPHDQGKDEGGKN